MRYLGGKYRIAKYIVPHIQAELHDEQWYVEPFAGGMNVMSEVDHDLRIAGDKHPYLIALFKALVNSGWEPPDFISEEAYMDVRSNKTKYPGQFVGYVGFNSFAEKWFAGYPNGDGSRDRWAEQKRHLMKQAERLKGVKFYCSDYASLAIPDNSVIYCDPPYAGTSGYTASVSVFNSQRFWQWAERMGREGNTVFVSEYQAPPDNWSCVWEKEVANSVKRTSKSTERLFKYCGAVE